MRAGGVRTLGRRTSRATARGRPENQVRPYIWAPTCKGVALVGMGVRFVPAPIGVLVYRLFNFWLPIVPALALMPTIRDLRTRFRRAERTA